MATKSKSQIKKKRAGTTSVATRASKSASKRPVKKAPTKGRARASRPGRVGPVNEWLELRRSAIHGLGGFARAAIPKGTQIIEYVGEKISNREADLRYDDEKMKQHHTFLFILNERTCVDAAFGGNEARFLNHSCDPNCEAVITRGHIWIEAKRAIPKDTELVYDYQFEDDPKYTEEDLRFYVCRCGAPNCRGTIVKTRKKLAP